MSQQINLYQPVFRRQRKLFSAMTIAQAAGLFIAGLALIYAYGSWQVASLGDEIATLEAQRSVAMTQLQTLSAQARPSPRSQLVADQLREAERETLQKRRLLLAFQTRRLGNTRGFAAHLEALARQRIDGLWLTRVEVRDGGVALEGETEAGELVPRYLARLGTETAFRGTEFSRFKLTRGDDARAPVEFDVATASVERAE